MGFLSRKKKISVSSTSYNLAGDEDDRVDYLKTTVISHLRMPKSDSMANTISSSYLFGPGIKARSFIDWADRTGYNDEVGLAASSITTGNSLDYGAIVPFLPSVGAAPSIIQMAEIGDADESYWVDGYMLLNHPDLVDTEYTSDFDYGTGEITLTFEDTTTEVFTVSGYDLTKRYMYVLYSLDPDSTAEPVETGVTYVLDPMDSYPSTAGWTVVTNTSSSESVNLDEVTLVEETYSDATPPTSSSSTTSSTHSYTEAHRQYTRTTYKGERLDGSGTWSLKEDQYEDEVGTVVQETSVTSVDTDMGGGVTKTTTTTVTTDVFVLDRSYRIDEQEINNTTYGQAGMFIYQQGSGNSTLDAMFAVDEGNDQFFPFIPIRLNNKFVSTTYLPDTYAQAKKAFKRAFNGSFDDIVESLKDNESLKDIDYAYAVFGVAIDVLDNSCRKYVFNFFDKIYEDLITDPDGEYSAWQLAYAAADASQLAWKDWKDAQSDISNPLYGTAEPTRLPQPNAPGNRIRISSDNRSVMNYDITISWTNIRKTTGTGKLKPDAKYGELWFTLGNESNTAFNLQNGNMWLRLLDRRDSLDLNWQIDDDNWATITIWDLTHTNKIYGGKAATITAREALTDPDESGFIIPLHKGIHRTMSLVDVTQMANANTFLVLNSYKVTKQKWYQTGIFKIVMIIVTIVLIVVTVLTAGATAPLTAGVMSAFGVGLTAAAIIIAVGSMIVGMLLMRILTPITTALFGEKVGAIVAAVAVAVIGVATGNYAQGIEMSMSAMTTSMSSLANMAKLTMALMDGVGQYMQIAAMETLRQTQGIMAEYETGMEIIEKATKELLGAASVYFDPMDLTKANQVFIESPDSFFSRTLMTASEMIELSLGYVSSYTDFTLSTHLS